MVLFFQKLCLDLTEKTFLTEIKFDKWNLSSLNGGKEAIVQDVDNVDGAACWTVYCFNYISNGG